MAMKVNMDMQNEKIHKMTFGRVYPLYIQKVERKGRTKEEVDKIIFWMTGYSKAEMQKHINKESTFDIFFDQAPKINPNVSKITGTICGVRVEEIKDETVKMVRYLDKLIDELAKDKAMEKILRT